MIDEATRAYVMVAAFIKPGAEYVGPSTHMFRQVFWAAYGGMDLDLDTLINSQCSWLNKPEYAVERSRHVSVCEFLREKSCAIPKWDLPDNPFDISEWLDVVDEDNWPAKPR